MLDEATRRELSLEYVRRINAGDVEGVLALFTEDVHFYDPVGGDAIIGHDALRKWLGVAVKGNLHETPGTPCTPQNSPHVATPMTIEVDDPFEPGIRYRMEVVGVCHFNDDGLIDEAHGYWGRSNVTILKDGVPQG